MTACKECTHYDVCGNKKEILSSGIRVLDSIDVENVCPYFKYRSRSADLPCKVGDYLYRPDRFGIGKYLVVGIQLLNSNRIDIVWKLIDGVGIPTPYISAEDIGKTVFLTREEAEITLEAWKERERRRRINNESNSK